MALIYPQNGDLKKLLKSSRKKVPQSARLSAGGGVQKLKGQCPNAPRVNLRRASLTLVLFAGWTGVLASTSATFIEALVLLTVFFPRALTKK